MKQVNNLILLILLMFFITDIPMAVDGKVSVKVAAFRNGWLQKDFLPTADQTKFLDSLVIMKVQLNCFQQFSFIINCSYSVLCYSIFTSPYKKTLKSLLRKKYDSWFSFSSRENPENITELTEILPQSMPNGESSP